jgi:hypothetical protein
MTHPEDVVVVRLDSDEDPTWDWTPGPIGSLTTTGEETSIVCRADLVPEGPRREGPFRAVEIAGPLAFGMVGVLADILHPLIQAKVSILTISTYDTDWVLVPTADLDAAVSAWRRTGLIVTPSTLIGG